MIFFRDPLNLLINLIRTKFMIFMIIGKNVVTIKSRSGVLSCTNSSLKCANTCKDTGSCEIYLPVPKISNNSTDDGSILTPEP